MSDIYQRKRDHIDLCNTGDVGPGGHRGLFEDLALVHDAMPELAMEDLDTTTRLLDHTLKAPVMVTGMGHPRHFPVPAQVSGREHRS